MNLYRSTLIASLLALFSQSSLLAQEASREKPAKSDTPASDSTPAAEEKPAGDETEPAEQPKADDEKPKPDAEAKPNEIDELVAELDHERLTKRQQAQKKLLGMGKAAIPALAKAALSGRRETIEKSIDVLAKLAQSKDEDTKDAARVTLQMLSESEQPSTADRAKLALNSKELDGIKPFEGWDNPGNEFAGGGQRNRSVSVSSVNGVRSIHVKEGGRETSIQELAGGKLFVSITGGEEPLELTVKNLDDLRKKHPEAAALYEQYADARVPAGFNFQGMPFGKPNGGFEGGNANVFGNGIAIGHGVAGNGNLGNANQMLIRHLEELKERMTDPAMQAMIDQQIQTMKHQN
ncbi:MAG: hypothetical protein ACK58L_09575 [Planctomycetota bacterium]